MSVSPIDTDDIKWISAAGKDPLETLRLHKQAPHRSYAYAVNTAYEFITHVAVRHASPHLLTALTATARGNLVEAGFFGALADELSADIAVLNALSIVTEVSENEVDRPGNARYLPLLFRETAGTLTKWEAKAQQEPAPSIGGRFSFWQSPYDILLDKAAPLFRRLNDPRDPIYLHYDKDIQQKAAAVLSAVPLRYKRPRPAPERTAHPD
jgi:hypothetical protein